MVEREAFARAFPFINELKEKEQLRIFTAMIPKAVEHGQFLIREGSACAHLPFVTDGALRVFKVGEQGKELTLYRVERGESCILTATCILNRNQFPALVQAEGDTSIALLPAKTFSELVENNMFWRQYLWSLYAHRLEAVLSVVEEVAFHHVDARIITYLLEAGRSGSVRATHQQIASEVGTSREVVTRILGDLESHGIVTTSRGLIAVTDRAALQARLP